MVLQFIDREQELRELREAVKSRKQELVIIYGRRRIGKTELILEATRDVPRLYYLAVGERNLERFYVSCVRQFPEASRLKADWEVLFDFLKDNVRCVILDEFQNLISEDRNFLHLMQAITDVTLRGSSLKLFLLGSSVSVMTSQVLASPSPLYGRRTGSMELRGVSFFELKKFFPRSSAEERACIYGFAGGVPFYLTKVTGPFWAWLEKEARQEKGFLRDEVEFLLKYEFTETRTYKLILEAIANGKATVGEIRDFVGVKRTNISPYLRNLLEVRLIKREIPVTESARTRQGRYCLADNFRRFWFRYIYPRLSSIEEGVFDVRHVRESYHLYLGHIFEDIAREFLVRRPPFPLTAIGRWWFRDEEIDIVAFDEPGRQTLFCECKWQDAVDARAVLAELKRKAALVRWRNAARKERFAIFARSFKEKIQEEGTVLFDLGEIDSAR